MIHEQLSAGEMKTNLPANGHYIFVERCPNTYLVVRAETGKGTREYVMKERDTNYVPSGEAFTELSIVNTGEHRGEVILRTGFGVFTQSNDHQKVVVDNEINLPSRISFAKPQPIYPASDARFQCQIENWPGEYPVTFKGTQSVRIDHEALELHRHTTYTFETKAIEIKANPGRRKLIIHAPKSNDLNLLVQGFLPVPSGETVWLPASTNQVRIDGIVGDGVFIGEQCLSGAARGGDDYEEVEVSHDTKRYFEALDADHRRRVSADNGSVPDE